MGEMFRILLLFCSICIAISKLSKTCLLKIIYFTLSLENIFILEFKSKMNFLISCMLALSNVTIDSRSVCPSLFDQNPSLNLMKILKHTAMSWVDTDGTGVSLHFQTTFVGTMPSFWRTA
jgi:hypothetical protein